MPINSLGKKPAGSPLCDPRCGFGPDCDKGGSCMRGVGAVRTDEKESFGGAACPGSGGVESSTAMRPTAEDRGVVVRVGFPKDAEDRSLQGLAF